MVGEGVLSGTLPASRAPGSLTRCEPRAQTTTVRASLLLRGAAYERLTRSEILPQLDIGLIQSLLDAPTQTAAVRELRLQLRKTRPK